MKGPLAGRRIVVTRAREQAGKLTSALKELGAEVIELPLIEIRPPDSYEPLDKAIQKIHLYQWLIVTSTNTVRVIQERCAQQGYRVDRFRSLKTVAVGAATAEEMRKAGFSVDLVPDKYIAEYLVSMLQEQVAGSRVLLARAHVARDVIPEALTSLGARVDVVDAYQTAMPLDSVAKLPSVMASVPDAVTFTSSSTVHHFAGLLRGAGFAIPPQGLKALSIGPVTSATLREFGWEPFGEAEKYDVPGLVDAAVKGLGERL